ncbi:hypothetical protein [Nitratifractor sp.]
MNTIKKIPIYGLIVVGVVLYQILRILTPQAPRVEWKEEPKDSSTPHPEAKQRLQPGI